MQHSDGILDFFKNQQTTKLTTIAENGKKMVKGYYQIYLETSRSFSKKKVAI